MICFYENERVNWSANFCIISFLIMRCYQYTFMKFHVFWTKIFISINSHKSHKNCFGTLKLPYYVLFVFRFHQFSPNLMTIFTTFCWFFCMKMIMMVDTPCECLYRICFLSSPMVTQVNNHFHYFLCIKMIMMSVYHVNVSIEFVFYIVSTGVYPSWW